MIHYMARHDSSGVSVGDINAALEAEPASYSSGKPWGRSQARDAREIRAMSHFHRMRA